ncbi:bifunctional DNA primase/polymerase [Mycolicibacterium elephantis]|uniref:bifunctional DNA primase/polymerase n=1 Tax=Mycolicibacterium elephantis TaxID=81858 RepID=UPI0007E92923|nr:bifunctional DNA primase/polymerase [Mycolicibacterium elephantis]OBB20602.1 hypothetical protein A5762_15180 [Mycolicibacterium elephantis]
MFIYTTCRDCGGQLHTTDGDTVHPGCTPKPTKAERLAHDWLVAIQAADEFTADAIEYDIEQLDNRPPRLLAAALRYASWGWPVFPLQPRGKRPATKHGFKDATTDPDRIRTWWAAADCNIGVPTGYAFDVIDIDPPAGAISLARMLELEDTATGIGPIPDVHGHVATASGGIHYYIPPLEHGNAAGMLPGIDYRGIGGYVVAPPSTLGERGRAWSWVSTPSPTITNASSIATSAA